MYNTTVFVPYSVYEKPSESKGNTYADAPI